MITIEDYAEKISEVITEAVQKISDTSFNDTICLGINQSKVDGELWQINKHLDVTNQIFNAYCKLFAIKERKSDLFNKRLIELLSNSVAQVSLDLRLSYVKHHKIEIPKVFKLEKVVFTIDYDTETEEAFDQIESLVSAWQSSRLKNYTYEDLWDNSKLEFALSERIKKRINTNHTVHASSADVQLALGLALTTKGMALIGFLHDANPQSSWLSHGKTIEEQPSRTRDIFNIVAAKIDGHEDAFRNTISINWDATLHGRFNREYENLPVGNMTFKKPKQAEPAKQ